MGNSVLTVATELPAKYQHVALLPAAAVHRVFRPDQARRGHKYAPRVRVGVLPILRRVGLWRHLRAPAGVYGHDSAQPRDNSATRARDIAAGRWHQRLLRRRLPLGRGGFGRRHPQLGDSQARAPPQERQLKGQRGRYYRPNPPGLGGKAQRSQGAGRAPRRAKDRYASGESNASGISRHERHRQATCVPCFLV